jgi:DNA-binding transcriptional LysR family regulator
MQQLEESVKASLFERSGSVLRLTTAGEELAAVAIQMESRLGAAERSIAKNTGEPSGRVRVSFPQILGRPIQQLLKVIPSEYPQLSLELACSDQIVSLAAGEAEIVVRMDESPPPDLVGIRVGALVLGLYSSRDYAERISDALPPEGSAKAHQWVDWGPHFRRKTSMKWLHETYPQRRIVAEGESGQAVLEAVEAGMGIGILASLHATHLHTWQLLPETVCPSIWLLTTAEARTRSSVKVVLDALRRFASEFGDHLYKARPAEFESPKGHSLG